MEGGVNGYESRERDVSSLLYSIECTVLFGPVVILLSVRGDEKGNRTLFFAITTLIIINHTQSSVRLYYPPELRPYSFCTWMPLPSVLFGCSLSQLGKEKSCECLEAGGTRSFLGIQYV